MKVLIIIFTLVVNLFSTIIDIQTYQANFTQLVTNPSNTTVSYEGKIYIKQPSKMLWQYKTPIIKYVYMDKLKIIIDEPELEQAIFTHLTDEINLIDFLNNPDLVDDKYKLTFEDDLLIQIQYSDSRFFFSIILTDNIDNS